jgi:hypothetical protein
MGACIEFEGGKSPLGYGVAHLNGKTVRAHRVAYCGHHGITLESIKGLSVRHRCDNPPCINPNHLLLGTHTDNMQDKVLRGRQSRGETMGTSKLTDDAVKYIRQNHKPFCKENGTIALARRFGVTKSTIWRALSSDLWKHVETEANSRKGGAHRSAGVSLHKPSGKWQVRLRVNGKSHYIGLFATEDEGRRAYAAAAARLRI